MPCIEVIFLRIHHHIATSRQQLLQKKVKKAAWHTKGCANSLTPSTPSTAMKLICLMTPISPIVAIFPRSSDKKLNASIIRYIYLSYIKVCQTQTITNNRSNVTCLFSFNRLSLDKQLFSIKVLFFFFSIRSNQAHTHVCLRVICPD